MRMVDGQEKQVRRACVVHADRASAALLRRAMKPEGSPVASPDQARPSGVRKRAGGEQLDIFVELERACADRALAAVREGVTGYARLTLDEACSLARARVAVSIEAAAGQPGPAHAAIAGIERAALLASLRRLPSPEREHALALLPAAPLAPADVP